MLFAMALLFVAAQFGWLLVAAGLDRWVDRPEVTDAPRPQADLSEGAAG